MYTPYPAAGDSRWSSLRKWLLRGIALDLLVIVALLDYATGRDFSFTLMYLAPISVAIWYIGPIEGLAVCFLAAISGLVLELVVDMSLPAAVWNAGVRLGVYVVFYAILNQLRDRQARGGCRLDQPGARRHGRHLADGEAGPVQRQHRHCRRLAQVQGQRH